MTIYEQYSFKVTRNSEGLTQSEFSCTVPAKGKEEYKGRSLEGAELEKAVTRKFRELTDLIAPTGCLTINLEVTQRTDFDPDPKK